MQLQLLQWDEARAVGGTNTGPTVLNRLVTDAEFTQMVSNHFRLNKKKNSIMELQI